MTERLTNKQIESVTEQVRKQAWAIARTVKDVQENKEAIADNTALNYYLQALDLILGLGEPRLVLPSGTEIKFEVEKKKHKSFRDRLGEKFLDHLLPHDNIQPLGRGMEN